MMTYTAEYAWGNFQRRDMFDTIAGGNSPEWEFAVQLFTKEEADKFPFDHLDATKLIPEKWCA